MSDEVEEFISAVSRPRSMANHLLATAMMMQATDGDFERGSRDYLPCDVGPEPRVCTVEEGQKIARQIAAQRKAKRGRKCRK